MTSFDMARQAYGSPSAAVRTARATEYDLLARITRRLKAAEGAGFAALAEALHENRRLWSVLAADVAGNDNQLPQSLRASLFHLAEFTRVHSRKVLASEASAEVLIDINTAVMRGLRPDAVAA